MVDLNIRMLPVVKDGKLVGTISRADICQAIIAKQ
jgi:CBS domain-containing protein